MIKSSLGLSFMIQFKAKHQTIFF